jgi:hypothetical protein
MPPKVTRVVRVCRFLRLLLSDKEETARCMRAVFAPAIAIIVDTLDESGIGCQFQLFRLLFIHEGTLVILIKLRCEKTALRSLSENQPIFNPAITAIFAPNFPFANSHFPFSSGTFLQLFVSQMENGKWELAVGKFS